MTQTDGGPTDVVITSTEQTRAALVGRWQHKNNREWQIVFAEKADGALAYAHFIDTTCVTATSTSISGCTGVTERPVSVSGRVVSLQDQITTAVMGNAPRGGVSSTRKLTISTDGTFLTEYNWSIGYDSTVWHGTGVWVKAGTPPNCQNSWECRSSTDDHSLSCGEDKVCAPIYCTGPEHCPPATRCDELGELSARPRVCLGLPGWAACVADLTSDPNHCGACGHSCQGGACSNSKCRPTTLATVSDALGISELWATPSSLLLSTFANNRREIHRIPRSGGTVTMVMGFPTTSTTEEWIWGAPVFQSPHIYWIQAKPQGTEPRYEARLMRRDAETGAVEELASGFFADQQQISVSREGVMFVQRFRGELTAEGYKPDVRRLSSWSATTRMVTKLELFGDFAEGARLFSTGFTRSESTGLVFHPYDGSSPRTYPGVSFGRGLRETGGYWMWQGPTHPAWGGELSYGQPGGSIGKVVFPLGTESLAHVDVVRTAPQPDAGFATEGMPTLVGALMTTQTSALLQLSLTGEKKYIELPVKASLLTADERTLFIYADGRILALAR